MRGFDSANQTAANATTVALVSFVELAFDSATVRLCTGARSYTWGGYTWLAAGNVGDFEPLRETAHLEAHPLQFNLNGVDPANVAIALAEPIQGRRVRIYLGYLDTGHELLADPELMWSGRLDTMDIAMGETARIAVVAHSKLADWERPRVRRYTDSDQRAEYPDDAGLEFVSATAEKELVWGTY